MNKVLHIDVESRSAVDLKKTGAAVYFADPTTDFWVICYAFDDEPVQTWFPGQPCPADIADHILEGGLLAAWNAAFERLAFERILGPRYHWPVPSIYQWRCVMVQALAMSLPGALGNAAPALGLPERKDEAGGRLMMQMARPRKKNPLTWWDDDPVKLQRLAEYCAQDVIVEREIEKRLRPLKESELALWHLDQLINSRGVYVDVELCNAAISIVERVEQDYDRKMLDLTGMEVTACSNRNQLITWLRKQGLDTESVAKDQIEEMLADKSLPPIVREVLELRRASAKASVAKIQALLLGMDDDRRVRMLLQFLAASTGRWGGRRFQPQNIVRPDMDLGEVLNAIQILRTGDYDLLSAIYDELLTVVGNCIRGMISAAPGHRIVAADYSNIEGRTLAWLAGEEWKLQAFRDYDAGTGHDLYKITAGGILGKKPEDITKSERQAYGKVPELALGFQGGVGAFQTMAVNYGVNLTDKEVEGIRDRWRANHPNIKQLWYDLETAATDAIRNPGEVFRAGRHIRFKVAGSFLFMRLPSGRFLSYAFPRIAWKTMPWTDDEGKPVNKQVMAYMGVNSYTRKWELCYAYGGLLAENAASGTARDVMAAAMPRLEAAGYPIILTVHDEVVTEPKIGHGSLDELCELMVPIDDCFAGLPVSVAGFEAERYGKGE